MRLGGLGIERRNPQACARVSRRGGLSVQLNSQSEGRTETCRASRCGALFLQQYRESRESTADRTCRIESEDFSLRARRASGREGGREGEKALTRQRSRGWTLCMRGCFCMAAVLLNVPEKLSRSLVAPRLPRADFHNDVEPERVRARN